MNEIKDIIDDIGNAALEASVNIAALAVISNSGKLIHQTKNFDLSGQTQTILNILKADSTFVLNKLVFIVSGSPSEGIIGTNELGMGYILILPFEGGVLVSYAMPQADPNKALAFLKSFTNRLNGKV